MRAAAAELLTFLDCRSSTESSTSSTAEMERTRADAARACGQTSPDEAPSPGRGPPPPDTAGGSSGHSGPAESRGAAGEAEDGTFARAAEAAGEGPPPDTAEAEDHPLTLQKLRSQRRRQQRNHIRKQRLGASAPPEEERGPASSAERGPAPREPVAAPNRQIRQRHHWFFCRGRLRWGQLADDEESAPPGPEGVPGPPATKISL